MPKKVECVGRGILNLSISLLQLQVRQASNPRAQKQPTSCDQGAGLESTRSEEAARLNKGELQVREVGQVGVHLWGQWS